MTKATKLPNVSALSSSIGALHSAQRQAETQIDTAVTAIRNAHQHLTEAARTLDALVDGTPPGVLAELAEYLRAAKELCAETVLAVAALRPARDFLSDISGRDQAALKADARAGMANKRLAAWETEALREAAVEALAKP